MAELRRVRGLRKQLYQRFGGVCMWCKKHIPFNRSSVEHIVPLSAGGTNAPSNLGLACKKCNNERRS